MERSDDRRLDRARTMKDRQHESCDRRCHPRGQHGCEGGILANGVQRDREQRNSGQIDGDGVGHSG